MTGSNRSSWLHALIGAVATIVLSFTVISPLIGGALAGYLSRTNGVRIGAIAGGIAAVPIMIVVVLIVGLAPLTGSGLSGVEIVLSLTFLVIIPLYVIGLSMLGGYLGVYVRNTVEW